MKTINWKKYALMQRRVFDRRRDELNQELRDQRKMREVQGAELDRVRAQMDVFIKELKKIQEERDWLAANSVKSTDDMDKLRSEYIKLSMTWNSFQALRRLNGVDIKNAEVIGAVAMSLAKEMVSNMIGKSVGLDFRELVLPQREYRDGR